MTLPFGRRLRKVISGGQTGADRTALECAKALGLETGGYVPKGWRTDEGPDPSLSSLGCIEHASAAYPPRTEDNVCWAEATVWFGKRSPGWTCTRKACLKWDKPFIENPTDLRPIAALYAIVNFAGNRRRTNPGVVGLTRSAFQTLEPRP